MGLPGATITLLYLMLVYLMIRIYIYYPTLPFGSARMPSLIARFGLAFAVPPSVRTGLFLAGNTSDLSDA